MRLLPLLQPLVNTLPPSFTPYRDRPQTHTTDHQKAGANGAEPTNPNLLDRRQTYGAPRRCKNVANHVVARDNLCASVLGLHHIEAICIQAGETEELRNTLNKH